MTIDLYNLAGRVRYGDFVEATSGYVRAVAARNGLKIKDMRVGTIDVPDAAGGISVSRGPNGTASANLYLPPIDPDTVVTGDFARSLLGTITHELAHALYTDMPRLVGGGRTLDTPEGRLAGVVEDYFIERQATKPGDPLVENAPGLLGKVNGEVMTGAGPFVQKARDAGDVLAQAQALILSQINRSGRQEVDLSKQVEAARAAADPDVVAAVDDALDQIDRLEAADAGEAFRRTGSRVQVLEKMMQRLKHVQQQQKQQKPDGQKGGDKAQGGGQGGGGSSQQGGLGTSKAAPGSPEKKAANLQSKAPRQTQKQQELAHATLPMLASELGNDQGAQQQAGLGRAPKPDIVTASKMADSRSLADAARRALKAADTVTVSRRLQSGRMDRRALTRASLGSHDVFQRKRLDEGIRTAVLVMVDTSSSMNDYVTLDGTNVTRINAVAGMATVILPAIERAGADVALGVFGGMVAGGSPVVSGLANSAAVGMVKPFSRRTPTAAEALKVFGAMSCGGGTPMIAPIMWAERQLHARRQITRRVCIWLCDGMPGDPAHVVATLLRRDSGIEHFGIGLQCSLADIFERDRFAEVGDMVQLPRAFEHLVIPRAGRR